MRRPIQPSHRAAWNDPLADHLCGGFFSATRKTQEEAFVRPRYSGIADASIEPLTRCATHLHARCARRGRLQCSLKDNTINFARMLAALRANQFSGNIALEYVWVDWEHCNEVDVLSETTRLKQLLEEASSKLK